MVSIALARNSLKSFQVRRKIGNNGIRLIQSNYTNSAATQEKGILGKIWNQLKGLTGWISERLASVGGIRNISFTSIWSGIVSTFNTLWTFNWQKTDEAIDQSIEASWQELTVRMAGVTGRTFGYLVCGAVPGTSMVVINKPLAIHLLKEVGEEAFTDLANETTDLLHQMARATLNAGALTVFKNVRKWIKKANKDPNYRNLISTFISPEIIDSWGEEKGKEWSFQSAFQKRIESLPEPWQDRVEEFVDEFSDACIEAGYVIAGGLDEWVGLNALTRDEANVLGEERGLIFQPNRDVESEKLVFRGREQVVKAQVIDVVNQQQLLDNREIVMSLPTEEWGRIPVTSNNGVQVEFQFFKYAQPPYFTKERAKDNGRQRIMLTNVKKSALAWDKLKQVWDATNFNNGKVKTIVTWSNGRKSQIWTKSEGDGERVAKALSQFAEAEIIYPLQHIEFKGHNPGISETAVGVHHRQHLASIKIWNWERITKYERSQGKVDKTAKKRLIRTMKLHYEQKPSWWDGELGEALKDG